MQRPKSMKQDKPHTARPDLDNIIKATLDGLVDAGVLDDDKCVVSLRCSKRYAAPGEQPHGVVRLSGGCNA